MALGSGHYSSQTRINAGGQNGATIRVTSEAIIEVRPAALGQIWYRTCQETIGRRHEQIWLHLRLRWPGKGPLFESDLNKRRGNRATIRVTSEAVNEVRPAALGLIQPLSGKQK